MTRTIQRRAFDAEIKTRSNADGSIGVRGYAAVFNREAHGEMIMPQAFNRTIAQRDNIRLLVNHEGVPLASTKSGTLTVGTDDHGYWFDAPNLDPANPDVQRLCSAMGRGDIDQCSFAGYFTDVVRADGIDQVREVKGTDVSIVTYPWYEDTEASLTGDREVDRVLVTVRSLSPEQRELTIVALGDIAVTAPVTDSSVETETSTEDCCCDTCGGMTPADSNFCCCCGADMASSDAASADQTNTVPMSMDPMAASADQPRGMSVAEARALLGLAAA